MSGKKDILLSSDSLKERLPRSITAVIGEHIKHPLYQPAVFTEGFFQDAYTGREMPIQLVFVNHHQAENYHRWHQQKLQSYEPTSHVAGCIVGRDIFVAESYAQQSASSVSADNPHVIYVKTLLPLVVAPEFFLYFSSTLQQVEKSPDVARKVTADVGCGDGSLGIAALKNGSSFCHFIDIYPYYSERTRQNLELNQLSDRATVHNKSINEIRGDSGFPFDDIEVVIANIGPHKESGGWSTMDDLSELIGRMENVQTVIMGGFGPEGSTIGAEGMINRLTNQGFDSASYKQILIRSTLPSGMFSHHVAFRMDH